MRWCIRNPIPEIEMAAHSLNEAVSAHLRGERRQAEQLFRDANDQTPRTWLEEVWGKGSIYARTLRTLPPATIPENQRAEPRDPTETTKLLIHQRDGYYCRFCQIPVIRDKVRKAICREYPEAVPWGRPNISQHAAFQVMWAQYDHVLPWSRGGTGDAENLHLTCAACNYGRMAGEYGAALLEEQDLLDPKHRPKREGDWDGLQRFLPPPGAEAVTP